MSYNELREEGVTTANATVKRYTFTAAEVDCRATTLRASGQAVRGRSFSTEKHGCVAQRGCGMPVPIGTQTRCRRRGGKGKLGLVITYSPGSKATTVDESRVVLVEYLRINTRRTARRDEDESRCRVHYERINPTGRMVVK